MTKKLIDVKISIEDFITEAKACASQHMGFAAMATIFPVILSVSEAVYRNKNASAAVSRLEGKLLFKEFVPYMIDRSWLIPRRSSSPLSDQDVAMQLLQIRDSLAHQLSLPNHVGMINTKSEAKEFLRLHPALKYAISVVEFVEEVNETIERIIKTYPNAVFDPNPSGSPRSPGKRVIYASGSSGSSPSRK